MLPMEKQTLAFGLWPSPISAEAVAEGALRFGKLQIVGGAIYWSESRPAEKGRAAVMCRMSDGTISELLPAPYSARSRVHEYGGGEFLVADGNCYFVNDADQDVYEASLSDGTVRRLTQIANVRFADFAFDARNGRLIAVGESHDPNHAELPKNALWTISIRPADGANASILAEGYDFYASPRLNAAGDQLAFLAWSLPAMPWDAAQLFVADVLDDGSIGNAIKLAGEDGSACFQPEWGADGSLYFVWDRDGFGNLFKWSPGGSAERITHLAADLSMPLWSLNAASYVLLDAGRAYVTFTSRGKAGSGIADLRTGIVEPHENLITASSTLSAGGDLLALCGMCDDEPLCLLAARIDTLSETVTSPTIIRRSTSIAIGSDYGAPAESVEISGKLGPVYGLLYRPSNPTAQGPAGGKPPLIVNLHGGPTSASPRGLKARTVFFTSRGFAWLDLDYSGSVGYGREYRDRLNGAWGVADVDDVISAARFASAEGFADPDAIFVSGGSAGGYTVLMAIATANVFRGAASYYGICDLVALQMTTHKFEQGYQSTLLGKTMEEGEDIYRQRSAINHVARIETPLILFQGAEDHVVPKAQSTMIAEALKQKGVRVEYHEFQGEGHGFRKSETIRACLERELGFYQELCGQLTQS